MARKPKLLIFIFLPLFFLTFALEAIVRLVGSAHPSLLTLPLPEEAAGILRQDNELFWSIRPNLSLQYKGKPLTTNSLGLRGAEIQTKKPNEFRILSLGESATFGYGVSDKETYSFRLQTLLNEMAPSRHIVVINAGVTTYSSFQSLKYLQTRGLKLKPDMVLFYHELNDYLPSSMRDSSNNEIGVRKTDKELYGSKAQKARKIMARYSALFRMLNYRIANYRLKKFKPGNVSNPLLKIGLADVGVTPRLVTLNNQKPEGAGLNERSLGRRVSEVERLENLTGLISICKKNGIVPIIIHPAYADTTRHVCLLTRFCKDQKVFMVEAFDILLPGGSPANRFFLDAMHPNPSGHLRLAKSLARFIYGVMKQESSRPVSPAASGLGLFSLFAAWFPGGATIFQPYISCFRPLTEPDVRDQWHSFKNWRHSVSGFRVTP